MLKPSVQEKNAGNWKVDSTFDQMDDIPRITLLLNADEPLPPPNDYRIPAIVIRCIKRQTEAFIDAKIPVEATVEETIGDMGALVRFRFDGDKPVGTYWPQSSDHEAIFVPKPIAFANLLLSTGELLIEFTPERGVPTTARFHTKGLASVLDKVANACHWKAGIGPRQ